MAQYDTGLGWSAKDNWLKGSGPILLGTISDVGGPSFPNQPIPMIVPFNWNTIATSGFNAGHLEYGGRDHTVRASRRYEEQAWLAVIRDTRDYLIAISTRQQYFFAFLSSLGIVSRGAFTLFVYHNWKRFFGNPLSLARSCVG